MRCHRAAQHLQKTRHMHANSAGSVAERDIMCAANAEHARTLCERIIQLTDALTDSTPLYVLQTHNTL